MWSTSAGGHLMKVVNLTGFTVLCNCWKLKLQSQGFALCCRLGVFCKSQFATLGVFCKSQFATLGVFCKSQFATLGVFCKSQVATQYAQTHTPSPRNTAKTNGYCLGTYKLRLTPNVKKTSADINMEQSSVYDKSHKPWLYIMCNKLWLKKCTHIF